MFAGQDVSDMLAGAEMSIPMKSRRICMSESTEMTVAQDNEMGTLPVGKLLRKMALPLIFSMFVQVLYGLVNIILDPIMEILRFIIAVFFIRTTYKKQIMNLEETT